MVIFRSMFLSVFVVLNLSASFAQIGGMADSVIVVFGDTRTNHDVHRTVVKDIMHFKPLAVFHTGDLVYNGNKNSEWSLFREISAPIIDSSRFYPSFGNHERHSKIMSDDYSVPNNGQWYSVNIGKVHFTVIDNYADFSAGSEQYQWLVSDLASSGNSMFRVVVMHLPVYTSGPHKSGLKKIKSYLVPLFEKYDISVVFSGHVHCYEKAFSNHIYYITTGGGGAPLYPKLNDPPESQLYIRTYNFCTLKVKDNTLQIQALDTNLRVIDEVIVK
jgi:acid phosphatase type 7